MSYWSNLGFCGMVLRGSLFGSENSNDDEAENKIRQMPARFATIQQLFTVAVLRTTRQRFDRDIHTPALPSSNSSFQNRGSFFKNSTPIWISRGPTRRDQITRH